MSSLCWQAGILSFQLRKAGKSIGLSDCYIGTVAEENDAMIYALDRHFKEMKSHIDITFSGRRDRRKKGNHDWL
ncbi:MAG: hypothetical protein KAT53_08885 [Dehalococcoidia bacterium]|nr:hypothetical protein [Dehalococcoidia bacterium]